MKIEKLRVNLIRFLVVFLYLLPLIIGNVYYVQAISQQVVSPDNLVTLDADGNVVLSGNFTGNFTGNSAIVQSASFIIDVSGSTYRAWHGSNSTLFTSSSNASAVINNAIGNLTSGTVFVRNGTYDIDATISVGNGIWLCGEGQPSGTVAGGDLKGTILTTSADIDMIQADKGSRISNLGVAYTLSYYRSAILFKPTAICYHHHSFDLHDVYLFMNGYGDGITIEADGVGITGVLISNVRIGRFNRGIYLKCDNVTNSYINGITIDNAEVYATTYGLVMDRNVTRAMDGNVIRDFSMQWLAGTSERGMVIDGWDNVIISPRIFDVAADKYAFDILSTAAYTQILYPYSEKYVLNNGVNTVIKSYKYGFVTENSGSWTGTSPVTVAHGCAGEPDYVFIGVNGAQPYATGYTKNSTHIVIYHNGAGSLDGSWRAEHVP